MPVGFYDDYSFRWSPDVTQNLLAAQKAGASILHVTADWSQIAPTKPANPADGNDPAYRIGDLDQLVRNAGRYGLQVMINDHRFSFARRDFIAQFIDPLQRIKIKAKNKVRFSYRFLCLGCIAVKDQHIFVSGQPVQERRIIVRSDDRYVML